jgi:YHS domain-containing protein
MKLNSILSALLLAGVLTAAPPDKKKTAEPAETKDPVCGMTVDPKTAEKADYKGKTYYFCSREERDTFQKEPAKYVAADKKPEKK